VVDEGGAPARDEHVDGVGPLEQGPQGGAVGVVEDGDQAGGQVGGAQGLVGGRGQSGVGVSDLLAAAHQDGVADGHRQQGALDGDGGAGLVDHEDHAEGPRHAPSPSPAGHGHGRFGGGDGAQFPADGVGEVAQLVEVGVGQPQPVQEGGGQAAGVGVGEIDGVGVHNGRPVLAQGA
jgi:hypothetical protein